MKSEFIRIEQLDIILNKKSISFIKTIKSELELRSLWRNWKEKEAFWHIVTEYVPKTEEEMLNAPLEDN